MTTDSIRPTSRKRTLVLVETKDVKTQRTLSKIAIAYLFNQIIVIYNNTVNT